VNATDEVRFRLLRDDDVPATNPHDLAYVFGLQDTKKQIVVGAIQPQGALAFDFSLKVKKGNDASPVFTGRFASGPANDRFVYLSWWAIERGDSINGFWINRVKARLSSIDWKMIQASQEQGRRITADMTRRLPGDDRKFIPWYLE
jgi:hypothetical protein